MAHTFNDEAFVTAYNTRTGKKLGKVPSAHLKLFPNLSLTPKAKAIQKAAPKVPDFIEKEG